jgi:hypothetical protein
VLVHHFQFLYFSLQLYSLPESMAKLQQLELLDLYSNTFEEVPEVLKSMPNLKALDLEYNCFDVVESLKDNDFLDRYICMKCNLRSRLTGFLSSRMDCKKPPLDYDHPPLAYDVFQPAGMILLTVVYLFSCNYYELCPLPEIYLTLQHSPICSV